MAMVKCSKGHIYDNSVGACPTCAKENSSWSSFGDNKNNMDSIPATAPVSQWSGMENGGQAGLEEQDFTVGVTQPVTSPGFTEGDFFGSKKSELDDYDATQASPINGIGGFDPVVGWLICIKGPNRGRDYRLHSGTNFIGRNREMDVCIENDQTISKVNAASISYDDRTKLFFIEKGEVRNLLYLNGKPVRSDADLKMYDRIEIGTTELVFMPLCGDDFNWQEM